jgi:hypothetical protein
MRWMSKNWYNRSGIFERRTPNELAATSAGCDRGGIDNAY